MSMSWHDYRTWSEPYNSIHTDIDLQDKFNYPGGFTLTFNYAMIWNFMARQHKHITKLLDVQPQKNK